MIRISDRVRFCYREVVATGVLQTITVISACCHRARKINTRIGTGTINSIGECILLVSRLLISLRYYQRPERSLNRKVKIGLCRIGFFLIRQSFVVPIVCFSNQTKFRRITKSSKSITLRISEMRLTNRIKQAGATGYILLWLLGIPIPVLLLIFLLRGCT